MLSVKRMEGNLSNSGTNIIKNQYLNINKLVNKFQDELNAAFYLCYPLSGWSKALKGWVTLQIVEQIVSIRVTNFAMKLSF